MEAVELSYWFGRCNVMKRVITLVFLVFPAPCPDSKLADQLSWAKLLRRRGT
jgi:hypothetical protein